MGADEGQRAASERAFEEYLLQENALGPHYRAVRDTGFRLWDAESTHASMYLIGDSTKSGRRKI